MSPLLFASREGCVECAKVLVDAGADLNAADPDGISPLISALINGHYDVAGILVDKGAHVNLSDKTGRTALYAAVDDHSMPYSNRPSPKESDNQLTSLDIINTLLAHGANVNVQLKTAQPYRTKVDRGNDTMLTTGTTPLLRAAKAGDVVVVRALLDKGADPGLVTRTGINAAMAAAGLGTKEEDGTGRQKTEADAVEAIGLLLAAGVDLERRRQQRRPRRCTAPRRRATIRWSASSCRRAARWTSRTVVDSARSTPQRASSATAASMATAPMCTRAPPH